MCVCAANMQLALEHVCGKQTLIASILFFHFLVWKNSIFVWKNSHRKFSWCVKFHFRTSILFFHTNLLYVPYAGRRIKFCSRKSLRFSTLFLGIHFSEFRFAVFIPGAVERIHTSPTAFFSQPIFLTNVWTALSKKQIWKEKPPRLRCCKMPRIWKEKCTDMSCVRFTRLLGLLWKYLKKILRIRILRRVRRIDRFFFWTNLILRPALHQNVEESRI